MEMAASIGRVQKLSWGREGFTKLSFVRIDKEQETPQCSTYCKQEFAVKYIIALVKPFRLDEVRDALDAIGVFGMTVSNVKGMGRQKGHTEIYRGAEYSTNLVPKVKIEIAVTNELAPKVLEVIQQAANTNAIGDGKTLALELASAIRIRTGESGDAAL